MFSKVCNLTCDLSMPSSTAVRIAKRLVKLHPTKKFLQVCLQASKKKKNEDQKLLHSLDHI